VSNEKTISEDDVRKEHLKSVNAPAHWAYLFGVLLGSFVLMVLFIALLDGAG
jgi:hypothetical protein